MRVDRLKLYWLIAIALLVNAASLLNPILTEGDSVTYAAISQHMVDHNNWSDLVLDGEDWLDKPHFPFWVTALAFKVFGASNFAYALPGLLFHVLGGYFVYRIARQLYNRDAALLSLLVYLSVYHVMYTSSVVKAEAFLTGTITGATYYWMRFDAQAKAKYLLFAAALSAMSVMTKGIFTLITIGSGLVAVWLYTGRWSLLVSRKWWLALATTAIFTAPELLSLYLQFDLHPEKVVFGNHNVSGILFFVWDSQFGRFFNSGPIKGDGGSPFYFAHVFLWSFLPWVAVFLLALIDGIRRFVAGDKPERTTLVFLAASIFVTFAMFSLSKFQLDYYTVIVYPFAAIVCGGYLERWFADVRSRKVLVNLQILISVLVVTLALGMAIYVAQPALLSVVLIPLGLLAIWLFSAGKGSREGRVLVMPVVAVCILFAFVQAMMFSAQQTYGVAYNLHKRLPANLHIPLVAYQVDEIIPRELCVYRPMQCAGANQPAELPTAGTEYLLVIRDQQLDQLSAQIGPYQPVMTGEWIDHKTGLLPRMLRMAKGVEPAEKFSVVHVGLAR